MLRRAAVVLARRPALLACAPNALNALNARSVLSRGVALASLLFAAPAAAQSTPAAPSAIAVGNFQLKPSLELRTRGEYRRDAPDLGGFDLYGRLGPRVRDAWVISERARLGLGVENGAVGGQLTLQDARALGGPSSLGDSRRAPSRFEPYEAYLEMHSSGARPNSLRLGRQAVVWGEGRLVGNADFSPTGRSLDAARLQLSGIGRTNLDAEALAVLLEVPGPGGAAFGDRAGPVRSGVQLYGLLLRYSIDPLLRVEAFALARIARSDGGSLDGSRFAVARAAGETYTGAVRVSGDSKGLTYGLEGAYQFGNAASLQLGGADVSAFAAAAHVSKTLSEVSLTPTFRIGGSYASGDDGGGTYRQFDPLLPDPQRFHGAMDLFAWSNALDLSARAQIVPFTDATFALEYRYARLAEASGEWVGGYMNVVGRAAPPPGYAQAGYAPLPAPSDAELGHGLDAALSWRPWLPLELRAGWSGLLLGGGARGIMAAAARGRADDLGAVTPGRVAQYAFGQATLSMP